MKKIHILMLSVLLIFQTLLAPISTLAAELSTVNEANQPTSAPATLTEANDGATVKDKNGDDSNSMLETTTSSVKNETEATPEATPEPSQEPPEVKPTETPETEATQGEENAKSEEAEAEDKADEVQALNAPAQAKEITGATLTGFKMTINDKEVTNEKFSEDLTKDTIANFKIEFSVPMQDSDGEGWADGSYFEFQLPKSLIDYDQAFKDTKTVNGITYKYGATDNKVRVELSGAKDSASDTSETLTLNFKSGFTNLSDELEQTMEIPAAGGGTDTIKATFTFKPATAGEKVSKKLVGSPQLAATGNHQMEWEVWVNKQGKQLVNPTVVDNPTGDHAIVEKSVNLTQYKVGLNGVHETGTTVLTNGKWDDIAAKLTDKFAYKITYKTEVNLDASQRDGSKTFNNEVTFTNNGQPEPASSSATITYGKALEKHDATGNNYEKDWQIDYNHNLLSLAPEELTDTIEGPHDIDFSTIKVYKVNDDAGVINAASTKNDVTSQFTITPLTGNGKTFTIQAKGTIKDAYTIRYKSIYTKQDFIDKGDNGKFKNTVTKNDKPPETGEYNISSSLVKKNHEVNFDTKEITWTITVNSDNEKSSIENFTLTDVFNMFEHTGKHTYVPGSLKVNNKPHADPTLSTGDKGFTLELAGGKNTTIEYKTSFAISEAGAAAESYGNTATVTWNSGDTSYERSATDFYKPAVNTVNNGSKKGEFNYKTQEFTWNVRVNINKKNISGAILTDTIGDGHKLVPGSIAVYKLTNLGSSDAGGTISSDPISADLYTVSSSSDQGFTLTFKDVGIDAYVVRYQTVDSDNILGISSPGSNQYINNATFKTLDDQTFTFEQAKVEIDQEVANNLVTKKIFDQDDDKEIITWTIDVNKSHSNLGNDVKLTDLPGNNLMLLEDSIKIAPYVVNENGVSLSNDFKTPQDYGLDAPIFDKEGGFSLVFKDLERKGYQVQYQTFGFGKSGDAVENTATLHYEGATADNQKTQDEFNGKMNFSSSESDFTSTRGSAKFKKIGIDSATGEVKDAALEGVEFQLVRKTAKNEYILKTATTDSNGEFTFENIPYNTYDIREVTAPEGYEKLNKDISFKLSNTTTLDKNPNYVTTLVNVTPLPPDACDKFTLTIKDIDGKPVANKTIVLKDVNGTELKYSSDVDGKITVLNTVQAGKYDVYSDGEKLGSTTVKFTDGCEAEIAPKPTCDAFTIMLKEKDGTSIEKPREVTLKDEAGKVVEVDGKTTFTTDKGGKITLTSSVNGGIAPGIYTLYEGQQYLGEVELTYKKKCGEEFIVFQAPKCPSFILTVKDADGVVTPDKEVVIKNATDKTVIKKDIKTTSNGEVVLEDLEPGQYEVYTKDEELIGTFSSNTDCKAEVQPAPKCEKFTITIKDANGVTTTPSKTTVIKDAKGKEIAWTLVDGKLQVDAKTTPAGQYSVYDKALYLGKITISYLDQCVTELQIPQAPTCPAFTLTLKDVNGNPRDNVTVTLTDEAGALVKENGNTNFTTDGNGQIKIDNSVIAGKYVVKEGSNVLGEVTVGNTCEATIQPQNTTPPITVCEHYTIKVTGLGDNENTPRPGAEVVLKDKAGTTVVTGTTDKDGKVVFPREDLQVGEYTLYVDGAHIKVITVTIFDCQINVVAKQPAPSCPQVTVTLKDENGKARPNVDVTIKDSEGKTVATGTTDKDGKVTTEQPLTPGKYVVYEGDKKVGEFTKDATNCEYEVTTTPAPTCPQVTITVTDKDGKARKDVDITIKDSKNKVVLTGFTNDEGKLTTGKPLPKGKYIVYEVDKKVGEFVVDGTNCEFDVTTTEKPAEPNCDKPEPGQPTDPDCEEEPNKPGEGEENPVDPNNPGEGGENPVDPNNPGTDGGKPVDPNNPNQGGGDGGKPVDPNNPNQNGTDGGKPVDPNNPNQNGSDNGKPVNPNKPGTDHNTTNDGKNPNKLPQTDGASNTIFVYIGLVLMAISAFIFFRRKATAK